MGVDVDDVYVMHQLVQALRYVDARLKARNAGQRYIDEMCEITGQSRETMYLWSKSPYIEVASRMVGNAIITKLNRSNIRGQRLKVKFA